VRRPFDSRQVVRRGDEVLSTRITSFGRFEAVGGRGDPATTAVPPDVPAVVVNLRSVLDVGLDRGLLTRGAVRTVLDRRCQTVYSRQPLAAGELTEKPSRRNHVASCVDEAGIVLEEVAIADGKQISRTAAIAVEEEPVLDPTLFQTRDAVLPVLGGGGSVQEVKPESRAPGDFFELASAPEGFTRRGRFAVVPPQAEAFANPTMRNNRIAGVSDVWVRGPDVLIVEQGYSLGGADVFPAEGGTVDMGGAGKGRLLISPRRPELQSGRKGGGFVRVYGTVSVDELERVAARLQMVPGGTLEFLDPEAQRRADTRADD
jgi:hypothetical protein